MGDKYISDHTKFIAEMKSKDPGVEEGQRRGRAIFWDKRVDLDESKRFQQSEVVQPAYVYQNYVGPVHGDVGQVESDAGVSKAGESKAGESKAADAKPGDVRTPGTPATNKA